MPEAREGDGPQSLQLTRGDIQVPRCCWVHGAWFGEGIHLEEDQPGAIGSSDSGVEPSVSSLHTPDHSPHLDPGGFASRAKTAQAFNREGADPGWDFKDTLVSHLDELSARARARKDIGRLAATSLPVL